MGKSKSIIKASGFLLTILILSSQSIVAQQPSPVAGESENVELRRRIKELEERLEKLEAQQKPAANAPVSFEKATYSTSEVTPTDTIPATSTQSDDQAKSNGNSVLKFFKEVEVSGFIDGYYSYNFNKPAGRTNQLRSYETRNNEFALNLAEIVLEKKPDPANSRLGFRLDLNYGPAADLTHAAEAGNKDTYKFIQQMYGSYLAPVGSGLQIDVGKFVTWNSAEVIESKDNWNYTRGFVFTYGPFFHAGARAKYAFNSKVSLMAAVVNGWDTTEDNNSGKTFGVQLALTPSSKFSLLQSYNVGPEEPDTVAVPVNRVNDRFIRHYSDTVAIYNVNPKLSLMANYAYGIERQRLSGDKVHFQGLAAYLRFMPTDRLSFSPRFEIYDDYNGARTGLAQTLKGFTFTGDYKLSPSVLARLEYRNDWSNRPFFVRSNPADPLAKNQTTITAGMSWAFSTREQ